MTPTTEQILAGEVIAPWPDSPQEMALRSDADIVIYGGAAGGSKTYSLLLSPLRGVHDKAFRGAIFRRIMPQISSPGALWDESKNIYGHAGGKANNGNYTWHFASGAWLKFSHLQHEKNLGDWDGAQLGYCGIDQLEQFEERMLFYLQGRCRSPDYDGPIQLFATCNPAGPGHWLTELLMPWLMEAADGYGYVPDPSMAGVKRYFFRRDGKILWAEKGDRDEEGLPPTSITFIPARVEDNPAIMVKDRGYLQRLNALNWQDRLEKKEGRWGVHKGSGPFQRHQIRIIAAAPAGLRCVRYWDLADTEPTPKNPDPCHTSGVKVGVIYRQWSACGFGEEQGDPQCGWHKEGPGPDFCPECGKRSIQTDTQPIYIVTHATWFRLSGSMKEQRIRATADNDGPGVVQAYEVEPGSSGKDVGRKYQTQVFARGTKTLADRATGDKMARIGNYTAAAEQGRVWVVAGDWSQGFIDALENMNPLDVADAFAGSCRHAEDCAGRPRSVGSGQARKIPVHRKIDLGL